MALIRYKNQIMTKEELLKNRKDNGCVLKIAQVCDKAKEKRIIKKLTILQGCNSYAPGNNQHPITKEVNRLKAILGQNIMKDEYRLMNEDESYLVISKADAKRFLSI